MPFRRFAALQPSRFFRLSCVPMLLSAVACCSIAFGATAQAPVRPATPASGGFPHPSPSWSLPQRETLTYAVDWRVFPAGTAIVHMEADGGREHITVTGDSLGAINLLFRVSDRFEATLDRTTGCSYSFNRQIMEGRRQVTSEQRIDGAHGTSSYSEHNLVSRRDVHQTISIPPCVTDMVSGIFYAGSQPLEPGTVFHLPVVSGNHVTNVTMHVEARETIHTPTATYHTVRVQPTADAGPVRNRGSLWIWYSDDERHIPVQMRARLFWGTLTFRLTGIDNK
jgi:hypothetical protein